MASTRAELEDLYRRYLDACNDHDLDRMSTFYSGAIRVNDKPMPPGAVAEQFTPIFAAFPDWRWDVGSLAIDGDLISLRFAVGGTHLGTFADIPATNRRVSIPEFTIYRVEDGLFADVWDLSDTPSLLAQISS
ncbi:ester cyclase [Mycolicibacterium sp. J2]|uniref:ester cyclase n=1 Tax=Mycolicibacterium sp. J2 TaxID=2993511 RepID=UPI00224A9F5A|nr:ester cyclase [Mycolicibacterium sp. J2]MCX2714286.1 ester cyclase [Mycolicibacterium sp. J2]